MGILLDIVLARDPEMKNRSLDAACAQLDLQALLQACAELDHFRRSGHNLYETVRAMFFLYAAHRFHFPLKKGFGSTGFLPYRAYEHLLKRRFEESVDLMLAELKSNGPNAAICSALAEAYKKLAFETLARQVRISVRSTLGNQWMFRTGHPADHPLSLNSALMKKDAATGLFPVLNEATPVRMDISHSGWSDIFFLGMDYPEGANVCNISIDLKVRDGSPVKPSPPIETFFRVIDEPVIRLTSIDLGASADLNTLSEIFDFARDYLGLLKAALIASGIVPPGMEGADQPLEALLRNMIGPGLGFELVSQVKGIPKGSRLAVSTNLLASLIAVCMRASGQTQSLTGSLGEEERRLVAARAILGEWLGGSGGGWQDSGGIWPGIKLIQGVPASDADPEYGISKGRLLPRHTILSDEEVTRETRKALQDSLVLVHGGMAQDVGPILEMVTEKYLLRSEEEWIARSQAIAYFQTLVDKLKNGNIREVGQYTHKNFEGPIQRIIPWASNLYTEMVIDAAKTQFGSDFWGFWMLGGMAGGGMGFIFNPTRKPEAIEFLSEQMAAVKSKLEHAVPFAMNPVVYDFAINEQGTRCSLSSGNEALLPTGYYAIRVPKLIRRDMHSLPLSQRVELEQLGIACRHREEYTDFVSTLFDRMIPQADQAEKGNTPIAALLKKYGFDPKFHEQIKQDLQGGRLGLAQNRLAPSTRLENILPGDVAIISRDLRNSHRETGIKALRNGTLAIVSLAGGLGSRWTKGAGVVKSLNPFARIHGKHRNFIETHLAKSRKSALLAGRPIPHIFTTSFLTHGAIESALKRADNHRYPGPLYLSPGRSIGLRLVPMTRDLQFQWEETPRQLLDEQAQKMQESVHTALTKWAIAMGEGSDYTDNIPQQCVHPVGHWYEVPNMLLNGTLQHMLQQHPALEYLLVHNIDTLGVHADPALLGWHIASGNTLTTEVISRCLEDRGGGLARVNGKVRLVEGLALPDEKIEFDLSYYNSSTTWVSIDSFLQLFNLSRKDLAHTEKIRNEVRTLADQMPTYITIKDVKKRWGKGHEDVFPVAQFEKLWGDMTALPGLSTGYIEVPRQRGQQLKEVAQLDGWLRDGSAAYVDTLCSWE